MTHTIVLSTILLKVGLDLLQDQCEVVRCTPGAIGVAAAQDVNAQAAIVGNEWRFSAEVLDQIPSLLVIGRPGIGVDNIDLEAATSRGVAVVNTPDSPTVSTAEQTVSLLLALVKRHKPAARLLATGGDVLAEPMLITLPGKVLGLVGLGRIGGTVAKICRQGLDMKVIAYDPYISADRAAAIGVSLCATLPELLRSADFVSLHLPLTNTTRHLINSEALALLKPTAFLINCARGPIVDEAALIEALRSGRLTGAGLDVFDPEPPSPANPLLALENVVATPHSSGFTEDHLYKSSVAVAEQVLAVLRGMRPDNLVNPDIWDSPARQRRAGIA